MSRNTMLLLVIMAICAAHPAEASKIACSEEIQRGIASWYGPGFEGAQTKSEEIFDPYVLSAAHPDLPFGTKVKVMNLRNNASVIVKINDRGAFQKTRAIDLSEEAARRIGMIDDGEAAVSISRCEE